MRTEMLQNTGGDESRMVPKGVLDGVLDLNAGNFATEKDLDKALKF